jgi:elongation factor P hydroxylase
VLGFYYLPIFVKTDKKSNYVTTTKKQSHYRIIAHHGWYCSPIEQICIITSIDFAGYFQLAHVAYCDRHYQLDKKAEKHG